MFISKKKKSHLKKKTHIYRTFTARARTCGRAVDLPHVRLCRAASLKSSEFSKTVVKLTPTPNGPVEAGSTFKVRLPPNTLIDLRTISLFNEGTSTATGGDG